LHYKESRLELRGEIFMKVTWYGTATILLEQENTRLLFDPFLSRSEKAFKPLIGDLSAAPNILVTHSHLDHIVDIPAISAHGNGKAAIYCTKKPAEILVSKGLADKNINVIKPGDVLTFGSFEVRVLKGKHIDFDKWLLIKTLLSPRNLIYRKNLKYMLKENRICVEAGETVVYDITASSPNRPATRILLLGSCNLDENTEYPKGADLLILPLQGRTDIAQHTLSLIDRLMPKSVLLDHYDDSFPPVSSYVNPTRFVSLMRAKYPDVPVICTQAGQSSYVV